MKIGRNLYNEVVYAFVDLIYVVLAVVVALEAWIALYLYKGLRSLESLVYPIFANLLWIRENNYAIIESLTDILAARGVISQEEVASLRSLTQPKVLTQEDLDRAEALLSKKPEELTDGDLKELKRIAMALLTWPYRGATKLALRLLIFASQIERERDAVKSADRVEISYIAETCTIRLQLRRGDAVETVEEADEECVAKRAESLRKLARREDPGDAEALATYRLCRTRNDAGCKALLSRLSPLEKKSLDMLLNE